MSISTGPFSFFKPEGRKMFHTAHAVGYHFSALRACRQPKVAAQTGGCAMRGPEQRQSLAKTVGIPDRAVEINNRWPKPLIPRRVNAKFNRGAVAFINRPGLLKKTIARSCLKSRHIRWPKLLVFPTVL